MREKNVSKDPNTSIPGQRPDQASPNPGGNKIHGDKLNPGQGGQPDQRNNQPNNPDRAHHPQNQKR